MIFMDVPWGQRGLEDVFYLLSEAQRTISRRWSFTLAMFPGHEEYGLDTGEKYITL